MSVVPVTRRPRLSQDVASTPASLPLVRRLARSLEDSRVAYCHWKSNAAIERTLVGDNDLDLLVQRADVRRFTEVLSGLGFTRARPTRGTVPGIESFLGFDVQAERLVHVHAHYQLVVGHDRSKNYRIPIEAAYLRSASRRSVLSVPEPEYEYVVFVLRMTLKYCTWDEILWAGLRGRRAGPSPTERGELDHLTALLDDGRTSEVLREHMPYVGEQLFAECVRALRSRVSPAERARTARRLEIALQPFARLSRRRDRVRRILGRVTWAVRRRAGWPVGQRLASGGAMVGVMGGDGSGKSTALVALQRWLGSELDVRVVHLGKPRWSATTTTVRALLKVATLGTSALARVAPVRPVRRAAQTVSDYRPLLWLLCTARDRRREYRTARRLANAGGIVLCDRYPHPHLRVMETPLIAARSSGLRRGRLLEAMIRREEQYHRFIHPPELLVVLRVDPETAVARKRDESPESVRARGAEIWSIDWRGSGVHVVDASRSAEEVARDLSALVWAAVA